LAVFVHRDDATGGRPMSLLQPAKEPLIDPEVQVFCRFFGIAMAIIGDPAPEYRVEGTELQQGCVPKPPSRGHFLDSTGISIYCKVTDAQQNYSLHLLVDSK
jgi:hypothetical protein